MCTCAVFVLFMYFHPIRTRRLFASSSKRSHVDKKHGEGVVLTQCQDDGAPAGVNSPLCLFFSFPSALCDFPLVARPPPLNPEGLSLSLYSPSPSFPDKDTHMFCMWTPGLTACRHKYKNEYPTIYSTKTWTLSCKADWTDWTQAAAAEWCSSNWFDWRACQWEWVLLLVCITQNECSLKSWKHSAHLHHAVAVFIFFNLFLSV